MGKISDALDKYRQERKAPQPAPEMKQADWDALMRYNKRTGKLNLHKRRIFKDPGTMHRLLANKMILPDGRLTRTGKQKCEAYLKERRSALAGAGSTNQIRSSMEGSAATLVETREPTPKIEKDTQEINTLIQATNLSESDLAILMSYDRASGHLLKYDKDTGNLDNAGLEIIRDQGVLQRLLSAKMIYPGGKLTPAGIKTCAELPHTLKASAADTAALMNLENDDRQSGEVFKAAEKLRESDWAALMQYDRDTGNIIKYDSESGKLDDRSRAILRDSDAIQRLIDNRMILPGGWLTKEAKRECEKRRQGFQETFENKREAQNKQNKQSKPENNIPAPQAQEIHAPTRIRKKSPKIIPSQTTAAEKHVIAEVGPEPENKSAKRRRKLYETNAVDDNLVSLLNPMSYEAEQFKILRTNLLFPVSGQTPRSILVTSTVPGEGKSFVASNLAVALAQDIDRYVLVVDCDLRRPKIHTQFGFGEVPGLSDYLINGTSLSDLLINTRVNKLTILPAGKPPPNPAELLSSEKMSALLEEITQRYKDRMIIIDSPPPKLTAESSFLARQVDGIILVINYGKTRKEDVKELIGKMGKDKILGCIINRFDMRSLGYYGYRKYRQYGHYYGIKS